MRFDDIVEFFIDLTDLNYYEFCKTGVRPMKFNLVDDGDFAQALICSKWQLPKIEYYLDPEDLKNMKLSTDPNDPPQQLNFKSRVIQYKPENNCISIRKYQLSILIPNPIYKQVKKQLQLSLKRLGHYFDIFNLETIDDNGRYGHHNGHLITLNLVDKEQIRLLDKKIKEKKETHDIVITDQYGHRRTLSNSY